MPDLILASRSPRRIELLQSAEINFRVLPTDIDETPPAGLPVQEIPQYLAREKSASALSVAPEALILAADTMVLLENQIFGKPEDESEARQMLRQLSGKKHEVITGVCIRSRHDLKTFRAVTEVYFRVLTDEVINHYVQKYKPFDKAGAYAIQEWIGMVGIEKINGDYYNVMGLPIGEVRKVLFAPPFLL